MDDDTGDIPHSETTAELLDARGSPERSAQSRNKEVWTRRYISFLLGISFLGLGLSIAIFGPTLVDLGLLLGRSVDELSPIFITRSIGYLIGSILGGILFDRFNRIYLLTMVLLGNAVSMTLIPTQNIFVMGTAILLSGICTGFLDTGGNVVHLDTWGNEASSYFQALHFSFGAGGFIAPWIAKPFLLERRYVGNSTTNATVEMLQKFNATTEKESIDVDMSMLRVQYPFYILAVIFALIAAGIFSLNFLKHVPKHKKMKHKVVFPIEGSGGADFPSREVLSGASAPDRRWKLLFRTCAVCLAAGLFFLVSAMELSCGQLAFTYAYESPLGYTKSTASMINSLFWFSYSGFRFIAIFVSNRVRPLPYLVFDVTAATSGAALLLLWGQTSEVALILGFFLSGAGIATMFPAGFLWFESYLAISSPIASAFLVGASLGEFSVPSTLVSFIKDWPQVLPFTSLMAYALGSALVFAMYHLFNRYSSYFSTRTANP